MIRFVARDSGSASGARAKGFNQRVFLLLRLPWNIPEKKLTVGQKKHSCYADESFFMTRTSRPRQLAWNMVQHSWRNTLSAKLCRATSLTRSVRAALKRRQLQNGAAYPFETYHSTFETLRHFFSVTAASPFSVRTQKNASPLLQKSRRSVFRELKFMLMYFGYEIFYRKHTNKQKGKKLFDFLLSTS